MGKITQLSLDISGTGAHHLDTFQLMKTHPMFENVNVAISIWIQRRLADGSAEATCSCSAYDIQIFLVLCLTLFDHHFQFLMLLTWVWTLNPDLVFFPEEQDVWAAESLILICSIWFSPHLSSFKPLFVGRMLHFWLVEHCGYLFSYGVFLKWRYPANNGWFINVDHGKSLLTGVTRWCPQDS